MTLGRYCWSHILDIGSYGKHSQHHITIISTDSRLQRAKVNFPKTSLCSLTRETITPIGVRIHQNLEERLPVTALGSHVDGQLPPRVLQLGCVHAGACQERLHDAKVRHARAVEHRVERRRG